MKISKNIKIKLFVLVAFLVLMFVQIGPYLLYADENELTFSYKRIEMVATNEYYNSRNLFFSEAYVGQNVAYCLDYGIPLPVSSGGTVRYVRQLSGITTAGLLYGYPYASAASLGVNSDEEAKSATQLAIWRLSQATGVNDSQKTNYILDMKNLQPTTGYEDYVERVKAAAQRIINRALAAPYYANPTLNIEGTNSKITLPDESKMIVGPFKIAGSGFNISSVEVSLVNAPASAVLCDVNGNNKSTFANQEEIYIKLDQNVGATSFTLRVDEKGSHNVGKVYGTGNPSDGKQDYCFLASLPDALTALIDVNLPKLTGSIKILKVDQYDTALPGVTFELRDTNGKVLQTKETDAAGIINFTDLAIGKYVVVETEALEGYIMMDIPVQVDVTYNAQKDLKIKNTKIEGGLKIEKVGEDKVTPVAGVTFQVLDSNKNVIDTIVTNSEGIAISSNLPAGTYYFKEISAIESAHVMIDGTERQFTITDPKVIETYKVMNYYTRGRLTVHKITEDGKPIEGVVFDILNENKEVIDTITTDANGNATTSKQLKYGKYYYQEKSVPASANVILDNTMNEVIMEYTNKTVEVKNNYKRGQLKIYKTGTDGKVIPEVVFDILDANKNVVDTITTDASGIAITKKLVVGTYYYQEKSCPNDRVIIDDTQYDFVLSKNEQILEAHVENELIEMGRLKIYKTGTDGKVIPNVVFDILDANKNVVDTITTDASGIAMTKYLILGTYYYQEIPSANKAVIVDDTQYDFVLSKNEQILEAHVENELITGSLTIYKVDEEGNYLNGVTFTLVDEAGKEIATVTTSGNGVAKFDNLLPGKYNFKEVDAPVTVVKEEKPQIIEITLDKLHEQVTVTNNYARGQLKIYKTDELGNKLEGIKFNILDKDKNIVDTIVTDKDGIATSSSLLLGTYYYKEIESDNKTVVIDETEYDFVLSKNNQVIEAHVENELKRGSLSIYKVDENNNYLKDVTFTLIDETGKEIDKQTTNKDGIAKFENLLPGKYNFKEVEAPIFVVANKEEKSVEITVEQLNVEITVVNELAKGILKIHKTDMADNNLKGVTFEILDANKKVVDTKVTDENGILESIKLPIGKYYYREVKAEDENVIIDTKLVEFAITENEQVVLKEVKNKTVDGVVIITKVDADNKNIVLAGAEIQILDANKNVIDTLTTDENGQVKLGNLKVGKYYYKETKAPQGYILDSNEYEFNITKDAQVRKITFKNEAKKLPQTGGFISTNMLIVIIVTVVSVVGYIVITLVTKNKENV